MKALKRPVRGAAGAAHGDAAALQVVDPARESGCDPREDFSFGPEAGSSGVLAP